VIKVSARARRHEDRAGDPLDGLVNLFDLGIVLSVGFLLAALASLDLASDFTEGQSTPTDSPVSVPTDAATGDVPTDGETVIGNGEEVGQVYRLDDGRLVYVVPPTTGPAEGPTASPTP
jgi:hypothetical protein